MFDSREARTSPWNPYRPFLFIGPSGDLGFFRVGDPGL